MALRDGRWRFRLEVDGRAIERTTDDMTLNQVDVVERTCGFVWGAWDPPRSARTAIALFAVLLMVDGQPEDKALQLAGELPADKLRGAFTWEPPEEPLPQLEDGEERTDPPV
jgi:hypothetical protein